MLNRLLNRRHLLAAAGTAVAAMALPRALLADGHAEAIERSPLIYITPIQTSGAESSCQAEVWFADVEGVMYVVTAAGAWRAEAVRLGLRSARVWVGDVGPWKASGGRYRELPQLDTTVAYTTDGNVQKRVLDAMGQKYAREWGTWGPRFNKGLADGSRVMLEYRPA